MGNKSNNNKQTDNKGVSNDTNSSRTVENSSSGSSTISVVGQEGREIGQFNNGQEGITTLGEGQDVSSKIHDDSVVSSDSSSVDSGAEVNGDVASADSSDKAKENEEKVSEPQAKESNLPSLPKDFKVVVDSTPSKKMCMRFVEDGVYNFNVPDSGPLNYSTYISGPCVIVTVEEFERLKCLIPVEFVAYA